MTRAKTEGGGDRKRSRLLGALRLRHKISLSLVVAALLPVLVASWVAASVVLRGLESGIRDDANRQLSVGLNLVLGRIEQMSAESKRMAGSVELLAALQSGPVALDDALERVGALMPAALVQIADENGVVQARHVIGSLARFEGADAQAGERVFDAGKRLESTVSFADHGGQLLVRASAPMVDRSFRLRGVVVLSLPLDGDFARAIKSALGTEVLFFAGTGGRFPAASTFLDRYGAPVGGISIHPDMATKVARGEARFENTTIADRKYSLGFAPLLDLSGEVVGLFGVAVDRAPLVVARRAATRSLLLGAAGAFVFALGLAGLLSRRITRPLNRLHQGAVAIARGNLDHRIAVDEGDEIGDLATAFRHMTDALKENQRRLAARMREIVALHDAGRAVSSVIDLDQVLKKIVDAVARVLHVRVCALWLVAEPERRRPGGPVLTLGAARAKPSDRRMVVRGDEVAAMVEPLVVIAQDAASGRATLRVNEVGEGAQYREPATAAGISGSLVATPLERKGLVLGVIIVGRSDDARPFSEADSNLLATFADQAATAVENARLFEDVREFNEELEAKVKLRTTELTAINTELGRAITELRETQAQLILSERLAGLGQLVAGVAHEINSPAAAIRGTMDAFGDTVARLGQRTQQLAALSLSDVERASLATVADAVVSELDNRRLLSPSKVRKIKRELEKTLSGAGIGSKSAGEAARSLSEFGLAEDKIAALIQLVGGDDRKADVVVGYLKEHFYLHRSAVTLRQAIERIQRIVLGLKSYSHLDQEPNRVEHDVRDGLESTLVLFDHVIARGISVTRKYGDIPVVPVFVDELNQVWTNLIHNAAQAMEGQGELVIETYADGDAVVVTFTDDGPGIPEHVLPRIFEPFFTTKPSGEGTGLGLDIVRKIVEKHSGTLEVESVPGRTCFTVTLPRIGVAEGESGTSSPEAVGG